MIDARTRFVNLFQGQALGFEDADVDEENTAQTAGSPDEGHLGPEACCVGALVNHIWGGISDSQIKEPVACNGTCNGLQKRRETVSP